MALINLPSDYTRSGDNFLTRWGNIASMLPIPIINTSVSWFFGMAGTAVDAAGWLLRGKVLSAATVAASGAVSTTVNSLGGSFWWLNAGSGLASGATMGTHARAATEGAIGVVTGMLGVKPTVLRSYTAGVGSINSGPGTFATRVANERGGNANAMWNNYRNGAGADHVAALEAGRANGPNFRSA